MMVMYQNGRDSIKLGRVHREHWQCHLARCSSSPEHIDTLGSGTKEKSARPLVLNCKRKKHYVPDRASSEGRAIRQVEILSNKLLTTAFEASLECVTVM